MTDIYEKIKNGDYETKLQLSKKPSQLCDACGHNCALPNCNITTFCSNCGANVKDNYEEKTLRYKSDKTNCTNDKTRLNNMFKTDALTYCGIGNHKKADKAWQIAINERDNHQNIVEFLEEFAELMVD